MYYLVKGQSTVQRKSKVMGLKSAGKKEDFFFQMWLGSGNANSTMISLERVDQVGFGWCCGFLPSLFLSLSKRG